MDISSAAACLKLNLNWFWVIFPAKTYRSACTVGCDKFRRQGAPKASNVTLLGLLFAQNSDPQDLVDDYHFPIVPFSIREGSADPVPEKAIPKFFPFSSNAVAKSAFVASDDNAFSPSSDGSVNQVSA